MKAVNKTELLHFLEQRVELHLQEAIEHYQNMDAKLLLRPATNGGWSIAQCLEHLNTYGHFYLPEIRKGLNRTHKAPSSQFKSTWLGNYFTKMMEPGASMKKMKAFKNHIPPAKLDAHRVVAEFIQQQETFLSYLKQARKADLNAIRIPVSISRWIKLRLGDVFQFIVAHDERHLVQAKRNIIE